jgi:hypothetical protein
MRSSKAVILVLLLAPLVVPGSAGFSGEERGRDPKGFLLAGQANLAGAGALAAGPSPAWAAAPTKEGAPAFRLSPEHAAAVARRRRIVVQYDVFEERRVRLAPREWLDYVFRYIDQPGSQVDSVFWDMGSGHRSVYPSRFLEFTRDRQVVRWRAEGFEYVRSLIAESRRRHLEAFWHERWSEVDITPDGELELAVLDPFKAAHPDWLIRSWWWQGLWSAASPGLRAFKLRVLREIAESFDFDGIQIDFARHTPFLPPGRQWEERGHLTAFMRDLRRMLLEVERTRRRPLLVAAKVPENLPGCRADGLDVETWAREGLVDIFTLGSRSITVDVGAFRRIAAGRDIRLQPCLDDHHATDGYKHPGIEFLRGVFANWWQQGADSVVTFNWSVAPPDFAKAVGGTVGPPAHGQAYREVGSAETLRGKDKRFAVERRGVFPWGDGYFNRNADRQLPAVLANDGRASRFRIRIAVDPAVGAAGARATLRLVLSGAAAGDRLETRFNGAVLAAPRLDAAWKDPQIFSPLPQPNAGSGQFDRAPDPGQKLLLAEYVLAGERLRAGESEVELRVLGREPYRPGVDIVVEKIEVDLAYPNPGSQNPSGRGAERH